jgi:hypothetical protein
MENKLSKNYRTLFIILVTYPICYKCMFNFVKLFGKSKEFIMSYSDNLLCNKIMLMRVYNDDKACISRLTLTSAGYSLLKNFFCESENILLRNIDSMYIS